MTKCRGINRPKFTWGPVALELLVKNYADSRTDDLATAIGCTVSSCYQKARNLGLSKSASYLASAEACRLRRGGNVGAEHRFKVGQTTWNKGLKGSTGVQEACRATQFKKGRRPEEAHNYRPIGSHRINADGHLERKLTDDPSLVPARRWAPVYRLVWEAANGPIPAGHRIDFKPGLRTTDPDLITPDKLECISREHHMRRHTYHQYGPEIASATQLRGAITRQIIRLTSKEAP